jgi:Tripartite tricarboxylate transporter TctB family
MALRIKSSQDFWTGCAFMAFGAATAVLSQAHPLGSTARMGPGYFPTMLGLLLAAIGLAIVAKSLVTADGGNVERVHIWLLGRVLLAVAAFALLLSPLGLVVTAMIVVMVAAWAGHEFRFGEALVAALVLALSSYLLFIWGLNQPMPVWPRLLAS